MTKLRLAPVIIAVALGWTHASAASAGAAWKDLDKLGQSSAQIDVRRGGRDAQTDLYNLYQLIRLRAEDFARRYPTDPRRWDADVMRLRVIEQIESRDGKTVEWAAQLAGYATVVAAPTAGREAKLSAQIGAINARLGQAGRDLPAAELVTLATEADGLLAKNRADMRLAALNLQLAIRLGQADPGRSEAMLERVARSPEPELAKKAASLIHVVRSWREPLELKFKGLDGAPVDLAALRGKVVLLDFWATWCPPCRDEMPSVVAAYGRLRERGFEIIGISLDDDKGKLRDYLKAQGATWPQHFDGGGWQNSVAQRFGISSVPTMWLVDQQGRIVDLEARANLTKKVERLLGAK